MLNNLKRRLEFAQDNLFNQPMEEQFELKIANAFFEDLALMTVELSKDACYELEEARDELLAEITLLFEMKSFIETHEPNFEVYAPIMQNMISSVMENLELYIEVAAENNLVISISLEG